MTRVRLADNAGGAANGRDFLVHARIGMLRALNPRAFSSEVGPGSRKENASKQKSRPSEPGEGTAPQLEGLSDNKMKLLIGDLARDAGHPHLLPKTGELAWSTFQSKKS
jgi:hypothetical protein